MDGDLPLPQYRRLVSRESPQNLLLRTTVAEGEASAPLGRLRV